jgi:hypothetical protein
MDKENKDHVCTQNCCFIERIADYRYSFPINYISALQNDIMFLLVKQSQTVNCAIDSKYRSYFEAN